MGYEGPLNGASMMNSAAAERGQGLAGLSHRAQDWLRLAPSPVQNCMEGISAGMMVTEGCSKLIFLMIVRCSRVAA